MYVVLYLRNDTNKDLPPIASAKKVNVGCNKETNFIIKHVAFLIEAVVNSSRLHLEWDATPNCYLNCDLNIQHCRHDLILYAKDGTEIATGEVKPCNASDILVEMDKIRIAESMKKQLHQRL